MRRKTNHKKSIIKSTAERLRLCVFRSNKNIYAQLVNDETGTTVVSVSTLKDAAGQNVAAAVEVGKKIAKAAKEKNISKVVFDRNRYVYKGRVKALAESAREAGLEF